MRNNVLSSTFPRHQTLAPSLTVLRFRFARLQTCSARPCGRIRSTKHRQIKIKRLRIDFSHCGYCLCIIDDKANHLNINFISRDDLIAVATFVSSAAASLVPRPMRSPHRIMSNHRRRLLKLSVHVERCCCIFSSAVRAT